MSAPFDAQDSAKRAIGAMLGAVRWLTENMPSPRGTNVQAVTVPVTMYLSYQNLFAPRPFSMTVAGERVGMLETPFPGVFLAPLEDAQENEAAGRICLRMSDSDLSVLAIQERIWSIRAVMGLIYDMNDVMGAPASV